jgi:hypothetical protein
MYTLQEKDKQHVKKYNLLQIFNIIWHTGYSDFTVRQNELLYKYLILDGM